MIKCTYCDKPSKKRFKKEIPVCGNHYSQLYKSGKIRYRTKFEKNEIIVHDDFAEIILYDDDGLEKAKAKISLHRVGEVKNIKWRLKSEYVTGTLNHKNITLSRFLLKPNDDQLVDHIFGDLLDNRDDRLRIADKSTNAMNSKIRSDNKSGCKGVFWNSRINKWQAYIAINKKPKQLGNFDNLQEAIKIRKEAEEKYYGEFVREEES